MTCGTDTDCYVRADCLLQTPQDDDDAVHLHTSLSIGGWVRVRCWQLNVGRRATKTTILVRTFEGFNAALATYTASVYSTGEYLSVWTLREGRGVAPRLGRGLSGQFSARLPVLRGYRAHLVLRLIRETPGTDETRTA